MRRCAAAGARGAAPRGSGGAQLRSRSRSEWVRRLGAAAALVLAAVAPTGARLRRCVASWRPLVGRGPTCSAFGYCYRQCRRPRALSPQLGGWTAPGCHKGAPLLLRHPSLAPRFRSSHRGALAEPAEPRPWQTVDYHWTLSMASAASIVQEVVQNKDFALQPISTRPPTQRPLEAMLSFTSSATSRSRADLVLPDTGSGSQMLVCSKSSWRGLNRNNSAKMPIKVSKVCWDQLDLSESNDLMAQFKVATKALLQV
ncbi:hypothetical protein U9M48_013916 [Paspalum notatum var. saurae]|uniref:Uncharacterized protein n=1 Tax=Paspalum notatum var. saurae TaxID=547442 RepID=A0AAQ3T072_PASNO